MSSLNLFLKQLIEAVVSEEQLDESAVHVSAMARQGLALLTTGDNMLRKYVLWDWEEYQDALEQDQIDPSKVIVGYIKIKNSPACDMWTVETSAAQQGYGPGMYDIAMSDIFPDGLTSDRHTTSNSARKVWNYMFTNRAHEIDRVPAEEVCQTNQTEPSDPLNFVYKMKSYTRRDLNGIKENHLKAKQKINDPNLDSKIQILAGRFFARKYEG